MLKPYTKQALTVQQQLTKLRQHGLVVAENVAASKLLNQVGYYRLSAYWYPLRLRDSGGKVLSRLQPGSTFEEACELYEFDRKLRLLVLDAIERVEVIVRTRITDFLAHKYGALGHLNAQNFHPRFRHSEWLLKQRGEVKRSSDEFIRHYKTKYSNYPDLPLWMLTEIISLGALSRLYGGLKQNQSLGEADKFDVARYFSVHHKTLGSWLHVLTYVRNICAHHGRLWNRELAIKAPKINDSAWLPPVTPRSDRLWYVLLMLRTLLRASGAGSEWRDEVTQLLQPKAQ